MTKRFLLSILFLFSPSLAFAEPELESLMGHMTTPVGVHIQVYSGGCTWKALFQVESKKNGDLHKISFIRKKQDLCRAYLPYGQVLSFSFEELGLQNGDQVEIANPEMPTRIMRFRIGG
jgi:hypothetical protein